jgi:hypothetical protein
LSEEIGTLDTIQLPRWLADSDGGPRQAIDDAAPHSPMIILSVPARLQRTGLEMRFVIDRDAAEREATRHGEGLVTFGK